jgi:hypothetical protein
LQPLAALAVGPDAEDHFFVGHGQDAFVADGRAVA